MPSKLEQNWGQGQGNYKGTNTPPKFEQNLGQHLSNRQRKRDTCQYCLRVSNGSTSVPSSSQTHHLDASLGEEYETDLYEVDIKPEKYAQSVYSTSQNPRDAVVGRSSSAT